MLTILGLGKGNVTTLIEEFRYPRLGPGQMWEAFAADRGGQVDPRPPQAAMHCDQAFGQSRDQHRRPAERRHIRAPGRLGGLEHPAQRADPQPRPAGAALRAVRRPRALRYRDLVPRGSDDVGAGALPGQLDLPPRPGTRLGGCRTTVSGAREWSQPGHDLPRGGVLLLRGRRDLEHDRRAGGRARKGRARARRPDRSQQGHRRRQGPRAEGVPDVRRRLRGGGRDDP